MKVSAIIIALYLTVFILGPGCSKEEEPAPVLKRPKVVKPIKRPAPEKGEASITDEKTRPEPKQKKSIDIKTAKVEKRAMTTPAKPTKQKETSVTRKPAYYVVKKGNSLSMIAGREDIYGDPLKWPILYRLNRDKLGNIDLGEDFADRDLPEGLKLKIITPEAASDTLTEKIDNPWVLNVLSVTTKKEIIPVAVKLMNNGCSVYIIKARVKGKDWMRLRVGFFKNKAAANKEGKRIMSLLNHSGPWVTKADKKELEEFGGLID